jgi:hypothetical protein
MANLGTDNPSMTALAYSTLYQKLLVSIMHTYPKKCAGQNQVFLKPNV